MEHTILPDMVRASILAFRGTYGEEREVYYPVCLKYRAGDGHEVVNIFGRLHDTRKLIGRYLIVTQRYKQAFAEEQRGVSRGQRRRCVGLNIARTALQTVLEGASYVQFEHKLQSLHLADVEIGSMNHSINCIRTFVESMTTVMDRKIGVYMSAIDPITSRKRVFAFMSDKDTELYRTGAQLR